MQLRALQAYHIFTLEQDYCMFTAVCGSFRLLSLEKTQHRTCRMYKEKQHIHTALYYMYYLLMSSSLMVGI